MRIAIIGTRGLPATHGGVERAVESLSKELVASGHSVTVFGRRGYCSDERSFDGVDHIPLFAVHSKHLEALSHTAIATMYAVAHRRKFDVVHYHATGPALFSVVTRLFRIPTVATIHGFDWKREKWGRFARFCLRIAARVAVTVPNETIAVGQQIQADIARSYGTRSTLVRNGVDYTELDGPQSPVADLKSNEFALFLGRLVPEKQVHVLIAAYRHVDTEKTLAIAGPLDDTPYVASLRALAEKDPRVVLLDARYGDEKVWLMHNARCFILPSSVEGLPIALLEALACGTQAIVSDIPENVEAITFDGRPFGITVRTGHMPDLADAIQQVFTAAERVVPDPRATIGTELQWSSKARATLAVYERATRAPALDPSA